MVDRIVANVNGEIILMSEVKKQIALLRQLSEKQKNNTSQTAFSDEKILNDMIDEKIMAHYAKENNVVIKESAIDKSIEKVKQRSNVTGEMLVNLLKREGLTIEDYRNKLRNQMMIRQIMSLEVQAVEITDDEAKSFYRHNSDKFMKSGRVRVGHIVFLLGKDGAREQEAFRKAKKVIDELGKGADFAFIAREYSEDASAVDGGDLGWFARGKMLPAFEKLAFSLKKGEIGGPEKTKHGYHIVKVLDRENPEPLPYEDVAEKIKNKLKGDAYQKKSLAWMERLRSQAYIEILY